MNPRANPYTPNAGARPPVLVGRDAELEGFEILLERLRNGYAEQSMLITGLRGVGKTVLLGAFEDRALHSGWVTVPAEIGKNEAVRPADGRARAPRALPGRAQAVVGRARAARGGRAEVVLAHGLVRRLDDRRHRRRRGSRAWPTPATSATT